MIDPEMLKALGWSDELVRAATNVARRVETAAVTTTTIDVAAAMPMTAGSQRADVSGPPVAQPELRIEVK